MLSKQGDKEGASLRGKANTVSLNAAGNRALPGEAVVLCRAQ